MMNKKKLKTSCLCLILLQDYVMKDIVEIGIFNFTYFLNTLKKDMVEIGYSWNTLPNSSERSFMNYD